MLYTIYHGLTALSGPFLRRMTAKRLTRGKEHATRYTERFGESAIPRPEGKVMWCHGASVGESLSVLPLLTTLKSRLPKWHFIVTTGTLSSATLMEERLPEFCTHQFIPWDHPDWVKKFMDHWQPDAVLWLESELWPNILAKIQARDIPAALLNARMRPATAKNWRRARGLIAQMLSAFRFILVGARDYLPTFELFGGKNVHYIGNIKFGAKALPVDDAALKMLRDATRGRLCLGFISTHDGEESLFADTVLALKKEFPDLLAILAPRHAPRGNEIATMLAGKNLNVAQRSWKQEITPSTDIYLADTIGELGLWYALCPMAVIGGSFVPHGGQNPIEAAHFGTAVLYGPHMFNFPELCDALEQAGAALALPNTAALLPTLQDFIRHPGKLQKMREAATQLATQNVVVIDAFADEILTRLVNT